MDATGCRNIVPEEDYAAEDEVTPGGQKDSRFWLDFGAYDTNTTSSNYYVGKPLPAGSNLGPDWHDSSVDLPP